MMHVARSKVGQRVAAQGACGCRYLSNQRPSTAHRAPAEFTTPEHMLRPPRREEMEIMKFNKKNFRTSRFPEKYDLDFDFKNTNNEIAGDPVPHRFENEWRYRLTIMRGDETHEARADTGKKLIATAQDMVAKGTPPDAKWINKAIFDVGTADQVEQLFHMAEKQGVVDNNLVSAYIYNIAKRKDGHQKAIEKYESVKDKADDAIHASGLTAYAKAMKGEKALEIYEQLQKKLGKNIPTRVHSSLLTYYFDFGQMRKGFEFFENLEKSGAKITTKILTSLVRGYRLGGNLKAAQATFDSIAKRGLVADSNAHCEIVMAYARPGDDVGKMMGKLQEMKDAGHRPPHTLYNYVIRAMIIKEEFNNAMMALDMQFREKSYPLEKTLVVNLARHFSRQERGMRIKHKTEYVIWVGRKAGLYTDDLFYLTTPHSDFMDEYYFRHHPEWDFPDEVRKPYQFKEFDERPVFHPEDQTNRAERRAHERQLAARRTQAQEQGELTWRAELPSFLEPFSVITMRTPEFRWAPIANAQDFVAQYDARVDAAWKARLDAIEALEVEAENEQRDIAALEKQVEERRALVREYKEAKERIRKEKEEWEARRKEKEARDAAKAQTTEVKAEEKEATEAKTEANQEKKEEKTQEKDEKTTEVKASETEKEAKPAGENGAEGAKEVKKEEPAKEGENIEASLESKQKELEETELKEKENDESIVLDVPKLQDMKAKAEIARVAREEKFRELYATRFAQYDDILPPNERIDRAQRRETVQQMRFNRVKAAVSGYAHTPAQLLIQQFDHKRLRELVVAVDDALAQLPLEDPEVRKPYDRERHIAHIQGYKAQALRWLAQKYEVADPLEFPQVPRKANDRSAPREAFVSSAEERAKKAQEDKANEFRQLTDNYRVAAGDIVGLLNDEAARTPEDPDEDDSLDLEDMEEDEDGKLVKRAFRPKVLKLADLDVEPKKGSLYSDISMLLSSKVK